MSSREIAELTGKRHDHVMADIRNMFDAIGIQSPEFLGDYKDERGRTYPMFNLPKDLTLTLVSGIGTITQDSEGRFSPTHVTYFLFLSYRPDFYSCLKAHRMPFP